MGFRGGGGNRMAGFHSEGTWYDVITTCKQGIHIHVYIHMYDVIIIITCKQGIMAVGINMQWFEHKCLVSCQNQPDSILGQQKFICNLVGSPSVSPPPPIGWTSFSPVRPGGSAGVCTGTGGSEMGFRVDGAISVRTTSLPGEACDVG